MVKDQAPQDAIEELGTPNGFYLYLHENKNKGNAYKANGIYGHFLDYISKHSDCTGKDTMLNLDITYPTYIKVSKLFYKMGAIKKGTVRIFGRRITTFNFNAKDYHLHGQRAMVVFGDFIRF